MKIYHKTQIFIQWIIYILTSLFIWIFCKLEIIGKDNIPKDGGPYIIASNHQSELDVFFIHKVFYLSLKKKPLYFVSGEKVFYKGLGLKYYIYGGKIFKLLGGYPAYRGKGDYRISLKHHTSFLKEGFSVCIFPEGEIPKNGQIGKGKGGVLFLAQETNTKIVPVAINGLNTKKSFLSRRKITISIGTLINTSSFVEKTDPTDSVYYNTKVEIVMDRIKKLI